MRPLLLLTLLLYGAAALGQEKRALVLPGALPDSPTDIGPFATFYEDQSGDTLPLSVILTKPFRPFLQHPTDRLPAQVTFSKWVRFSVQNTSPDQPVDGWLHVGRHNAIRLYAFDSLSQYTLLATNGGNIPLTDLLPDVPSRMAVPIVVGPGQRQTFMLNVVTFHGLDSLDTRLFARLPYKAFLNDWHQQQLPALAFYIGLIACLLFMGLFAVGQYLTNRDIIYAWYALYIFFSCLHFLRLPELFFQLDWWLPNHPLVRLAILPFVQLAMQFFYMLFVGTLLDLARYQPRLWRAYRYLLMVLALLLVGILSSFFIWGSNAILRAHYSNLAGASFLLLFFAEIALAGLALRGRHPLRGYAFTGLLLLMSGALGMFILNRIDVPRIHALFQMPSLLFGSGTLLEVLCFSLALGRRTRLIEIEKKQIQQRYAQDLEARLTERSEEIEKQSRLLETQHIRQLEAEFDQRLADSEMTALRAQMNPHFIFNCLNSIKLYTLQNDTEKASDYLTKFSRLIRLVLENSRSELVTLQNELDALQLYIELEAMRFKQKVQFTITVSPDIDQRFLCIPPLLLQPYVENAIWHGLMHKPEGGTVSVDVSQPQDNLLHIEITDNGIGRRGAMALKSKSAGRHKSFGMQVTADRIRMINQLYNTHTKAQIFDLVAPDGEPMGTKVVLLIPV